MDPRSKTNPEDMIDVDGIPSELDIDDVSPDSIPSRAFALPVEESGAAPDDDEDDAYQESDEALPDDAEESAIARHPSREGGLFDEI